ncbi:MAG TPA: DUF2219 family protein, partial [Lacibacter sp.]|nr:DUF2219 family protein [Lacibacter sp.]
MKQHPTYPLLFSLHAMIVLLLLTVLNNRTEAQQANRPFLRELSFVTDNDNYDLGFTDRYYTNGFFLRLHWVHDSAGASATVRRIRRAELAHKTYNPVLNRTTRFAVLREMDRPYAGWLYASRGETRIYPRHSVLQLDASLGVMGPAAGGREVQNSWHNVFGLPEALAWDQQVRNSIDLSLLAAYYQAVVSDP